MRISVPQLNPRGNCLAGFLISRAPLAMPRQTPFERAYYAYMWQLHRAGNIPFGSKLEGLLFQKGSIALEGFRKYDRDATRQSIDDELHRGLLAAATQNLDADEVKAIFETYENTQNRQQKIDADSSRLDRALDRNVYLVVDSKPVSKNRNKFHPSEISQWHLPTANVNMAQPLVPQLSAYLEKASGNHADLWQVSKNMAGVADVHLDRFALDPRTFFWPVRILRGYVSPADVNARHCEWLTKEEIANKVSPEYYEGIKDMLG